MSDKFLCKNCSSLAVWYYLPDYKNKVEEANYYCDDHVSRGCSCNTITYTNDSDCLEQYTDDQGRLLPCCEYNYKENGWYKPYYKSNELLNELILNGTLISYIYKSTPIELEDSFVDESDEITLVFPNKEKLILTSMSKLFTFKK